MGAKQNVAHPLPFPPGQEKKSNKQIKNIRKTPGPKKMGRIRISFWEPFFPPYKTPLGKVPFRVSRGQPPPPAWPEHTKGPRKLKFFFG